MKSSDYVIARPGSSRRWGKPPFRRLPICPASTAPCRRLLTGAVQPAQGDAEAGVQRMTVKGAGEHGQQAVAALGVVAVEALEQRQDGAQQTFVLA
jgi:hypothetical protein